MFQNKKKKQNVCRSIGLSVDWPVGRLTCRSSGCRWINSGPRNIPLKSKNDNRYGSLSDWRPRDTRLRWRWLHTIRACAASRLRDNRQRRIGRGDWRRFERERRWWETVNRKRKAPKGKGGWRVSWRGGWCPGSSVDACANIGRRRRHISVRPIRRRRRPRFGESDAVPRPPSREDNKVTKSLPFARSENTFSTVARLDEKGTSELSNWLWESSNY